MSGFRARKRFARAARAAPISGGMPLIAYVVGARPNFVKMAPVVDAMRRRGQTRQLIVHTGQHYDRALSGDILDDLGFPDPDVCLEVGSGSHGDQTGKVLAGFEQVLMERSPDLVVVAGDVNSTLACALASAKLCIPVAHLESGLRSDDWTMPEEVNRVLTDRVSELLLTHSPEAEPNLLREGIDPARVHYVGNTMIDSLRRLEGRARRRAAWTELGLVDSEYVLVTLHRPSNVDDPVRLSAIVEALIELGERTPVLFPIHPRTRARLRDANGLRRLASAGVQCIAPAGYLDFLSLQGAAGAVVTDSGGVQEEASALGVRCYTFRPNTERPVTLTHGTNTLLGDDPALIASIEPSPLPPTPSAIPLWDGHAAERSAEVLTAALAARRADGQARLALA
jgi:UDP-N-acetylglucosamine 2-epimerase (non-hydrolysing)